LTVISSVNFTVCPEKVFPLCNALANAHKSAAFSIYSTLALEEYQPESAVIAEDGNAKSAKLDNTIKSDSRSAISLICFVFFIKKLLFFYSAFIVTVSSVLPPHRWW
jgi:hypothetical protein